MTWLEEQPSPGSEHSQASSPQGQEGHWPTEGSPSRIVPVDRPRLEEAARNEDLEGSFSTRTWREADRPPNPNTEQRRRSSSSLRSTVQPFTTPTRHSDQWKLGRLQEWEEGICTAHGSKQDVPAVGNARSWRAKAD
ncbi:g9309 [Coccomyxa elongata]